MVLVRDPVPCRQAPAPGRGVSLQAIWHGPRWNAHTGQELQVPARCAHEASRTARQPTRHYAVGKTDESRQTEVRRSGQHGNSQHWRVCCPTKTCQEHVQGRTRSVLRGSTPLDERPRVLVKEECHLVSSGGDPPRDTLGQQWWADPHPFFLRQYFQRRVRKDGVENKHILMLAFVHMHVHTYIDM